MGSVYHPNQTADVAGIANLSVDAIIAFFCFLTISFIVWQRYAYIHDLPKDPPYEEECLPKYSEFPEMSHVQITIPENASQRQ